MMMMLMTTTMTTTTTTMMKTKILANEFGRADASPQQVKCLEEIPWMF